MYVCIRTYMCAYKYLHLCILYILNERVFVTPTIVMYVFVTNHLLVLEYHSIGLAIILCSSFI